MHYLLLALTTFFFMLLGFNHTQQKQSSTLYDFTTTSGINGWTIVNDDVMGGVSSSEIFINDQGNGVFKGDVSTANYGGFASVRYTNQTFSVGETQFITFRIKGDAKNYQFRIKHKSSDYASYIYSFETTGEWQEVSIPLSDLYASFRGRKLDRPNFDKSSFQQIAFLIANKKNESFRLEIDWIKLI